ncbi:MAG: 30S ribosomal protein S1 [Candidatus Sumerlaeia bacterium]|nr:30S ribosomal protein S1 [Candidatus Sumerlaeia bacterium]
MANENHSPVNPEKESLSGGEIEDELSPIDPMRILGRTGRTHPDETGEALEGAAPLPATGPEPPSPAAAQSPEPLPASGGDTPSAGMEPALEEEEESAAETVSAAAAGDEFGQMLDAYLDKIQDFSAGDIVEAEIVDVKRTYVLVDVGDKAEGVIEIDEFVDPQGEIRVAVGDRIPVRIMGRETETGQVYVSYRQAAAEIAWQRITEAAKQQSALTGRVVQVVKSGLIVDVGIPAFMPASQIDTSRVENLDEWVGREIQVCVLETDRERKRVIVSRRKLLQEDAERKRRRILESLEVGQERVVRVRKIMDFGAFADLGGIDGLIPRSEVSWEINADPKEYLKEGRDLKVRVISVDRETGRIALSRKQARPDPWEKIEEKYPPDTIVKGKVVGLADFGAFVSLEEGVRGLIHASDLSWDKGPKKVEDYLRLGDTVKAVVLSVDKAQRRMSLGLKQVTKDPWLEVEEKFPPQTVVKGTVTAVTSYGAFVRLTDAIEGLIHVSDMSWEKKPKSPSHYVKVGDEVEAIVLRLDSEKRRINLGLKQMAKSPFERFVESHRVGSVVQGQVTSVTPYGVFVQLAPEVEGLIHISQLDTERVEKPEDVVKVGDTVEAKVIKIDSREQKISLSRRAFLKEQESREVAAYTQKTSAVGLNIGELLRELNLADTEPPPDTARANLNNAPVDLEDTSEL